VLPPEGAGQRLSSVVGDAAIIQAEAQESATRPVLQLGRRLVWGPGNQLGERSQGLLGDRVGTQVKRL